MARNDSVGLAKQTAIGTPVTTPEYFVPVSSCDVNPNVEALEYEETTGVRFPSGIEYGTGYYEVPMTGAARVGSLPRILSGFMGAPVTSTPDGVGAPTGRKHLFNPAAAGKVLVPHSLLVTRTDPEPAVVDLISDAKGNELTFSVEPNGYLTFDASWTGLVLDGTRPEPTPTYETSRRMPFHQVKVYLSVNGGAETEIAVKSFSLTYANNLDTDTAVLGRRTLYALEEGNADATVSFTPVANLLDHYRRALLSTPDDLKVRMVAEGAVIGGAVKNTIEVIAYRAQVTDAPIGVDAGQRANSIDVQARCALDTSTSKFVEVAVTNTVTAY